MSNKSKRAKYAPETKESKKKNNRPKIFLISGIALAVILLFVLSTPGQLFIRSLGPQAEPVSIGSNTSSNESSSNSVKQLAPPTQEVESFKAGLKDEQNQKLASSTQPFIIKTAELSSNMKFFTSKTSKNAEISFFATLGSDGQPRVAFDACDVCYRSKKGYSQNGNLAVCNNCGNRYPIDSLGTENLYGGCWPSYLHVDIKGDEIHIDPEEIQKKEYMFL